MKKSLLLLLSSFVLSLGVHAQTIQNVYEPDSDTTWTLEGEIFGYEGAGHSDSWSWDGTTLKPAHGIDRDKELEWTGATLEGKDLLVRWDGETLTINERGIEPDSFRLKDGQWEPTQGTRADHTWLVEGELPVPLIAFVVFDLANNLE